jgi:hypothetical protein
MITLDGKWTMEGLTEDNPDRIKNHKELTDFIQKVGFLPLFKTEVKGFSVEELTVATGWWSGNVTIDPWAWRETIALEGKVAYGKLFSNKAGFVSREWYPLFASYRRDGYDFDSRYEDGLASIKCKRIIDVLTEQESLPSHELKALAGFGSKSEKGFESAMSLLQMQTYITVRGFARKRNKKGEEYGWPAAIYSLTEKCIGEEAIREGYRTEPKEAKEKIISHLMEIYKEVTYKEIEKSIR